MGLESLHCDDSDESEFTIVDAEQIGKDAEKSELDTPKPKIFARLNQDIKRIHVSPDGQYLISSVCQDENINPYLLVWHIDSVLESQNKFACDDNALVLKTPNFNAKKIKYLNKTWILSIDSFILDVNGTQKWCICAGSIVGDIYIWYGTVDKKTKQWIFESSQCYDFQFSFDYHLPIYILALKIVNNPLQKDAFHLFTGVYDLNQKEVSGKKSHAVYDWVVGVDNSGLKLISVNSLSGTIQHTDGISALDYNAAKEKIYSASWDRTIIEWDLKNKTNRIIGAHHDAITELRLINLGEQIVSSSLDKTISIWNIANPKIHAEFLGSQSAITTFDIQKNKRAEKVIISASEDNFINVWDVDHNISIQIIGLDKYKGVSGNSKSERGLDTISQLIISPDNKFVFIAKKHKILLFLSYGMIIPNYVRHFYSQIQFIKETDPAFYEKIYGDNLLQIALRSDKDQDDLMLDFYQLMKQRLVRSTGKSNSEYIHRLLGSIFIPSFVKFEKVVDPYRGIKNYEEIENINLEKRKNQKEYLASVTTRYNNYWHSVQDMFNIMLPNLTWRFHLFISTDLESELMNTRWTEIKTEEDSYKPIEILMKDRKQTALRFLMTLERVPTTLIPLVKSITINIEDDHGDAMTMDFSDFVYADNFIDKNSGPEMKHIYYSSSTFKIDEGYNTEENATLFIRKINVEYEETLNPNSNDKHKERDMEIFESFRDNFFSPHMPNVIIKVGKGLSSAVGKKADDFLSKLVLIGVVFTFIDIIDLLGSAPDFSSIPATIIYVLGWIGAIILTVVLINMIFKK